MKDTNYKRGPLACVAKIAKIATVAPWADLI